MCGICGKLTFDGAPGEGDLVSRMCDRIVHRGPDDEGVWTAPGVALGQRRLSIIDLSHQATAPLANEDGTVWVVFNGEIYNFQELRADLEARGHTFRAHTDTEVLVHLYEEHGTGMLRFLRGMFAFALWDAKRRRLFAARDRLGKKPLFYAKTPKSLVFGSALSAVRADPSVSSDPDFGAIDAYLTYQYVPSPRTAFAAIAKLPPAHFLTCTADGELSVERYWSPGAAETWSASREELEEEIVRRLRESVRLRMISDVPLGAFLSGGIDSGTVVALMAQESARPVKTFSIGFEDDAFNELPYARAVAERYGTEHHELVVRPDAASVLPLLVRHYGEPFADSSALPSYYVARMTRPHVTVALSGDGGDESFAGYHVYGATLDWSRSDAVPRPVRRALAGTAAAVLDSLPYGNRTARLARAGRMVAGTLPERYRLQMTTLKPQEKRAILTPRFRALAEARPHPDPAAAFAWRPGEDELAWMMRHDQSFYLPDCLMVKMDVASMANSLEVRAPFLDHTFVEFAAGIPSAMKRDAGGGKRILKSAVRGLLPDAVMGKRKTGFGIPVGSWFRGELRDTLRGALLDDRAARRGLMEPAAVRRMVDEHQAGRRDWSNRLWALLFLELWFRECVD
jgi:asparagine synthase (glutamine-hydrolysing)